MNPVVGHDEMLKHAALLMGSRPEYCRLTSDVRTKLIEDVRVALWTVIEDGAALVQRLTTKPPSCDG